MLRTSLPSRCRYYEKGGWGRVLGEGHGIAKGGEAFGVIAGEALRVQAVEVVAAQLAVQLAVPQDVVGCSGRGRRKAEVAPRRARRREAERSLRR